MPCYLLSRRKSLCHLHLSALTNNKGFQCSHLQCPPAAIFSSFSLKNHPFHTVKRKPVEVLLHFKNLLLLQPFFFFPQSTIGKPADSYSRTSRTAVHLSQTSQPYKFVIPFLALKKYSCSNSNNRFEQAPTLGEQSGMTRGSEQSLEPPGRVERDKSLRQATRLELKCEEENPGLVADLEEVLRMNGWMELSGQQPGTSLMAGQQRSLAGTSWQQSGVSGQQEGSSLVSWTAKRSCRNFLTAILGKPGQQLVEMIGGIDDNFNAAFLYVQLEKEIVPSGSSSSSINGKSNQVSGCNEMFLTNKRTSSVIPKASPLGSPSSSASSSPKGRNVDAIFEISDTALVFERIEIPLLNLPPSSAKSLRIPAILGDLDTSDSSETPSTAVSEGSGTRLRSDGGLSGGGARKEATPQNWRVIVLVSSEISSLTPLLGDCGSSSVWTRSPDLSSFPGFVEGLCSLPSSSSPRREFTRDRASQDIVTALPPHRRSREI
ncbi:hypothetical protein M5K25_014916 [Dendrobium thyrsiflorum]|uniref:Uncharacterized protein n=1 Tax=Dendrobium thyrsiflorum TaxID=117978 RepID=A0ABD0UPK3_DENTH